jgi:hypothetical protein
MLDSEVNALLRLFLLYRFNLVVTKEVKNIPNEQEKWGF